LQADLRERFAECAENAANSSNSEVAFSNVILVATIATDRLWWQWRRQSAIKVVNVRNVAVATS